MVNDTESTARVEKWAFGGTGLIRTPGKKVVFVPFTLPGETVSFITTKSKSSFEEGELVKVIQPSPHRVLPKCPYFTSCGGCQLQHADYTQQLAYKKSVLIEALHRVYPEARIEMTPADPTWHYRSHITLTLEPHDASFRMGYAGVKNPFISIEGCPIFQPLDHPIFKAASHLIGKLIPQGEEQGRLKIIKVPGKEAHLFVLHFKKPPLHVEKAAQSSLCPLVQGIVMNYPKMKKEWGNLSLPVTLFDQTFLFTAEAFLQNHLSQYENIQRKLQEVLENLAPSHLLELYGGIGLTSLLIAPKIQAAHIIEWDPSAVRMGQKNAEKRSLSHLHFFSSSVEAQLPRSLKHPFDTVVMNPPREGVSKEAIDLIGKSAINRLIYISCMPPTLSRDLARLKAYGFKWKEGLGFDMFPQTSHVESLVVLEK